MKLAYLSDVIEKLYNLNLQLHDRDKHLPQLEDKITTFTWKLEMCDRKLNQVNTDVFDNLSKTSAFGATSVIQQIK